MGGRQVGRGREEEDLLGLGLSLLVLRRRCKPRTEDVWAEGKLILKIPRV